MSRRDSSHAYPGRTRYKPKPDTLRRLVLKQAARLKPNDQEWQNQFCETILGGQAGKPALLWLKDKPEPSPFLSKNLTSWQPDWVETLASNNQEASRNPLFQAGCYYCLDFSSIFSASVLLAIKDPLSTVLDVCSAPGGKSIFSWKLFKPDTLICNEVIGKRHNPLIANLTRCQIENSYVTRLDPSQLAYLAPSCFDLVIVDAPCSGQSLIAKGENAAGAYQGNLIALNMSRQRRILANAVQTVAPGGYLAYFTCTYSPEENEKNVEWLLRRFPEFTAIPVDHLEAWRSPLLASFCYRLFPQDGLGAGGFTCLMQKTKSSQRLAGRSPEKKLRPVWQYPENFKPGHSAPAAP